MKFRIIATVVLLVVLGLAYAIFNDDQSQTPPSSDNNGIVLH